MKNKTFVFFIVLSIVVASIIGVVMVKKYNTKPATSANVTGTNRIVTLESATEVTEVSIVAKNWQFTPSVIKVKNGTKIKLKVKSIDVDYGFSLPDFKVSMYLKPGKELMTEFVANKKGEFSFFCDVSCGSGRKDMKGTLIVE